MDISNKLRELRKKENLTVLELSKQLNITRSACSNYENNIRQPDYDTLVKIAKFFGVTTDFLLGVED